MKLSKLAMGLVLSGMMSSASAQSVPDDVRCLLLSNMFAKGATEERGRQAAARSLLFYVGRLDGRATPQEITSTFRSEAETIDRKTAATEMKACAARVAHAEQAIEAVAKAAAPDTPPGR